MNHFDVYKLSPQLPIYFSKPQFDGKMGITIFNFVH